MLPAPENEGYHNRHNRQAAAKLINDKRGNGVLSGQGSKDGLHEQIVAGMQNGSRPQAAGF